MVDIMNELINDNDKNLMDKIEETSCTNIIHNQIKKDCLENNIKGINMDVNTSLTEEDCDDKSKDVQPEILNNSNNKFENNCDNVIEENNIAEIVNTDQTSSKSDDESEQVELQSKKKLRIIDSDSDDDDIISSSTRRKVNVIEDDNESVTSNESSKTNNVIKNGNKVQTIGSNFENKSEHSEEVPEFLKKSKKIFETLVDSESDEDEIHKTESYLENDNEHSNIQENNKKLTKAKGSKKESSRKGSMRDSKDEAMKKIHSETQRLIRESEISLPYHRPKSRTLQEFLTRKQISEMLPKAPTTASKIKMSSTIVSKILEDKEKEAEEFYKSSSSGEEEEEEEEEKKEKEKTEIVINHTPETVISNTNISFNGNKTPPNSTECVFNESTEKVTNTDDNETITNVENELDKDIEIIATTSEIQSQGTACEISNEKSQSIEKQISHKETENDQQNINNFSSEEKSQEIEDHIQGLPLPDFIEKEQASSKKQLLPIINSNIEPRLRGNPGAIIDLSCDVKPNKTGVESLLNRFFSKHTASDKDTEKTTEINVIHVEETQTGPKVVQHAFLHKQPILEKEDPELTKPGAKLKRLKEDLKLKMAMKRNEEWKQKELELKEQENQSKEDDELYDICNEEKFCDESSGSEESEPEENDIPMVDKRNKPSCEFVDDEAMESEDEDDGNDEINNANKEEEEEENEEDEEEEENEEEEEENDEEEEEEEEEDDNDNDESSTESTSIKKKLKPSRIIKAFEDDSNSSLSNISIDKTNELKKNAFERTATDTDIFETNSNNFQNDWNSDEECTVSIFGKNKQTDTMTQACKTPSIKTNVLDFVSPITQLTILNTNLDSNKKDSAKKNESLFASSIDSLSQIDAAFEKTPRSIYTPDKRIGLQKKLFDDFNGVTNDEDLMQLCSGAFPSTQTNDINPSTPSGQTSSLDISNTQMLEINKLDKDITLDNETSQDMKLFLDDNSTSSLTSKAKSKENSNTDGPWSELFTVVHSDDEENSRDKNKVNRPKKRRVKKLELSDDEDENVDNSQSNEEEEEEEDEYLDYDSEENEVIVSKKDIKKVTSEFVENEAELSESDWDSADEDEKDLDKLEREEGDEDDIDENKVRNQLEKIHMRQILDQDQREVRMLQELLFEDGDLHTDGSGRQRKFKWKNIDKLGENDNVPSVEEDANTDIDIQEHETELAWYKLRHEREKFIEEKRRADLDLEIEEDLEKSEIFKFGVKVLKRIESKQSMDKEKEDSSQNYDKSIEPIMPRSLSDLLNTPSSGESKSALRTILKKRSLLSRGEHELERIAKRVKLNDTVNLTHVNTKNFVFAHVSPIVKNSDDEKEENTHREKENKSKDKTSVRKKRKATTSMTPTTTKRIKQEGTDTNKKKLF